MSADASLPRKPPPPRARLAPAKGNELLGVVELLIGVLVGVSLVTHHPQDPSFFHQVAPGAAGIHNLIGKAGAEVSAALLQALGLPCLALPLLLVAASWRRLRRRERVRVFGRGLGAGVLLATLPPLLQITLERVAWRGEPIEAGGAVGLLIAEALTGRLNVIGALLVLLAGVVVGSTLVVQSSLGDVLQAWSARLRALRERLALGWTRRRERREKERARRRVLDKHLRRLAEEKAKDGERRGLVVERIERRPEEDPPSAVPEEAPGRAHLRSVEERLDLPLRVTERKGEGEFAVRHVRAPAPERAAPSTPGRAAQREFGFADRAAQAALPPINLLQTGEERSAVDESELVRLGEVIRSRCVEFGVEGTVEGISPGPVITVFEFQPAPGVKVSQIVGLQDDLALALKAESVRIDRIPGRSTLGIEVPNRQRAVIRLGHLLAQETFQRAPSVLTMALGTTLLGEPYYADLAGMPHLLVAGATGSGKSVGLQSMITSMIYKATREQVQFIFIDPKRIELGVYADIPHLKCEVVVEPKKAANALRWAVGEMERRYRLLAEVHVRSIDYYNRAIRDPEVQKRLSLSEGENTFSAADFQPLPYYVVVIDELADLMMVASAEVETAIARLAQMARAVGIHLIVATQRPSVDVLTGTIKANFPCRISFATASRPDSRTILDQVGAEKLLGKGDMLMMPPGTSRVTRLHGAYISEQETAALVRWLKKQGRPELDPTVLQAPEGERAAGEPGDNDDELFHEAARLVVAERQASASFLQRRMRIGFSRAARLIDMMERDGLLGPQQGSKPREVRVKADYFTELDRVREE